MIKPVFYLICGAVAGAALTSAASRLTADSSQSSKAPATARLPVQAVLHRLRINTAQMPVYQDWVNWHEREYGPVVATMEREQMYAEAVFRDTLHEPDFIYWLELKGPDGAHYDSSPLPADRKHAEYMRQILVKGTHTQLKTEFLMLPSFVEHSIGRHQAKNH
ncbi:DUF6176 family protein [Mucilaginibacter sp.]